MNLSKVLKRIFIKKLIEDCKLAGSHQWYTKLKRMTKYDQHENEELVVDEIADLSHEEQANAILNSILAVNNSYEPKKKENIDIPQFNEDSIPYLSTKEVESYINQPKTKPSTPPGDIPAKLVKRFSKYFSTTLTHILNACLKRGEWPNVWKVEAITPVPKVYPPMKMDKLRPISGLFVFNKIAEKIFSNILIKDMKDKLDASQFGNQKGLSIQHYLIKVIHKILTSLDNNSKGDAFAVIAALLYWKQAFNQEDPTLGIKSFQINGVRPAFIPMLINYFQGRQGYVKWIGIH